MSSFLNILLKNVLGGPSTDPFPFGPTFEPKRLRGRVVIDPDKCMGCGMCKNSCVAGAIDITKDAESKGWTITVWQDSCCLCASCRTYCPMKAVDIVPDWHSAHFEEDKYSRIEQHTIEYQPCTVCGKPVRVLSLEKARELYRSDPSVDPEQVRHMCRSCRQIKDAEAHVDILDVIPKKPAKAGTAAPEAEAKA